MRITREGNFLVGYGGGQRSILASIDDGRLASTAFDGEGRFQRDAAGRVTQFVYYEFGARLGVAARTDAAIALDSSASCAGESAFSAR